MLGHLQVMNARLRSLEKDLMGHHGLGGVPYRVRHRDIEERIVDVIELHARVSTLFEYARRLTNDAPSGLSQADMRRSLFNMGIADGMAHLNTAVRQRYPEL